jgi:hypothetical protein
VVRANWVGLLRRRIKIVAVKTFANENRTRRAGWDERSHLATLALSAIDVRGSDGLDSFKL